MRILRIISVWLVALCIASFAFGSGKYFSTIFLTFGVFMTLPALGILTLLSIIESVGTRMGHPIVSLAAGPVFGLIVPVFIYLVAPNRDNAAEGLVLIGPITLVTGLVWAASYFCFPRASRSRSPPGKPR